MSQAILIVEDDADLRMLIGRALSLEGYKVHEAENGVEAIRSLDGMDCPGLVLVDLMMPGMDGASFVKNLKNHPQCQLTKIVVVSGWDDLPAKAAAIGVDGFLRKPVDLETLYGEVERLLKT